MPELKQQTDASRKALESLAPQTPDMAVQLCQAGGEVVATSESLPKFQENLRKSGKEAINLATEAVNFDRCCTVLPAIGVLVRAAAEASGAFNEGSVPQPKFETVCARFRCQDAE